MIYTYTPKKVVFFDVNPDPRLLLVNKKSDIDPNDPLYRENEKLNLKY